MYNIECLSDRRMVLLDQTLKHLIYKVSGFTAVVALPLTGIMIMLRDVPAGMSLFLGSFLALLGFIASVLITANAVKGKGVIFSVLLNFLKFGIFALVMILLVQLRRDLPVFLVVGYTLILFGIVIYTKKCN